MRGAFFFELRKATVVFCPLSQLIAIGIDIEIETGQHRRRSQHHGKQKALNRTIHRVELL